MKRSLPVLPTILVGLAVAAMIGLGVWQLGRLKQKEAALAAYRVNMTRPATAYPPNPADEAYLFRTLSAHCLRVVGWQEVGGRARDGQSGWRHIASCATGAEGPGLLVDMGVSALPNVKPAWTGGLVSGRATYEPDPHSFLTRLLGHPAPLRLMIVSDAAAPGFQPSHAPDPSSVPNNHLSYAVQWFLFAAVALIIYALALRHRWRES